MARLTAAERRALPDSDFADPAARKFPMQDADHRRAAVMDAQTPAQKAEVRSKLVRSRLGKVRA